MKPLKDKYAWAVIVIIDGEYWLHTATYSRELARYFLKRLKQANKDVKFFIKKINISFTE